MSKIDVLGVGFDNLSLSEATEKAYEMCLKNEVSYIVTPNAEIVYSSLKDAKLKEILNSASLTVPDGAGVVLASKILGMPLKQKVAGIELAKALLTRLNKTDIKIFFLGAKPTVAEKAAQKLKEEMPDLKIAGVNDGYFKNDSEVIEKINASGADVLFVCLGAPRQEKWIFENKQKLNTKLLIGLGGSLDVFAGEAKRAPEIFIKLGLEWFYRLLKEPKRIGRMMCLPKFLIQVIKEKLKFKRGEI